MLLFYLVSALLLAALLGHGNPSLRALGRLLAAGLLVMIVSSILLANFDGTFAARPGWRVWSLNALAVAAMLGAAALLRGAWAGRHRTIDAAAPIHTRITRALHWMSAGLMISALPMGQFVAVLRPGSADHAMFLATHLSLGAAILALAAARITMRLLSSGPPAPLKSMAAHGALYALIFAISLTGLALASQPVDLLGLSFPRLPPSSLAETLHRFALPALLVTMFAAHLLGGRPVLRRMAP